jgi:hypothetical protein
MDEVEVQEKPSKKNKKEKKPSKKSEEEWVDSDEEPVEFEEPRKPNGQLGEFSR